MFTRVHKILAAVFVVQAVLAAILLTRRDDATANKAELIVAGLDAASVTQLAVYAKDGTKPAVTLAKRGDKWVVSSSFDYPVAEAKVSDVLASIVKMSAAAPIATQPSRHKQLRVDDTGFERKLVITASGGETAVLLGTQAGSRRTAVRRGGDARVFAVSGLSTWSIGSEPRDWVDTDYVKVRADEVEKVTIERDGVKNELAREGTQWKATLAGAPIKLAAGETVDSAAIQRVVNAATSIDLQTPGDPKRDASKPTATITIDRKPAQIGQTAQTGSAAALGSGAAAASQAPVVVDVIADGESYWVRDRASSTAVMVDKNRLSEVVELSRDKLVTKPSPEPKPDAQPNQAQSIN